MTRKKTRVYNVKDDVAGIIFQALADGNNVLQCVPAEACYVFDSVEGVLSGNCTDGYVDKNPGRAVQVDPRMTPG